MRYIVAFALAASVVLVAAAADATLHIDLSSPKICGLRMPPLPLDPYRYSIDLLGQFPVVRNSRAGLITDEAALRRAVLTVSQPGRRPERVRYDPALRPRLPAFALARYGEPAHIMQIQYDTRAWCQHPGTLRFDLVLQGEHATYAMPIAAVSPSSTTKGAR